MPGTAGQRRVSAKLPRPCFHRVIQRSDMAIGDTTDRHAPRRSPLRFPVPDQPTAGSKLRKAAGHLPGQSLPPQRVPAGTSSALPGAPAAGPRNPSTKLKVVLNARPVSCRSVNINRHATSPKRAAPHGEFERPIRAAMLRSPRHCLDTGGQSPLPAPRQ